LLRFRSAVWQNRDSALARHPGFAPLARATSWYLLAVDRYFVPGGMERDTEASDDRAVEEGDRRLLRHTGYADEA
jgi:hypothetical protein